MGLAGLMGLAILAILTGLAILVGISRNQMTHLSTIGGGKMRYRFLALGASD